MRKIILSVAVSLDGFIEGPNGEYDWCFMDQDYGMADFLKGIDAIFYGRKSYELMATVEMPGGVIPWADKKTYVFSNTLKPNKDYELVNGDIAEKVKRVKNSPGKSIWLFGGAELTSALMNEGLVDELNLAVHPILLGNGKLTFSKLKGRIKTKLLDSKTYDTGLVMLTYKVLNE